MKTFFLSLLLVALFLLPSKSDATTINDCLETVYNLDKETTQKILSQLSPLLNNPILNEFIDLSKNISLDTKTTSNSLIEDDACLKAPNFHHIIFENNVIRILDISTKPGERIPFHAHQWNNITIVIQGSVFEVEDIYGNRSIEDCPILVEKSEGSTQPHAYTNIGSDEFKAISFEFKN